MTAKQYYKMTTDMAYPIKNAMIGNNGQIVANIVLQGKKTEDAVKILEENDFFSLPESLDFEFEEGDEIKFEIRFHYGIDDLDIFNVDVDSFIDCSCVEGGKVVLSCDGYLHAKSVRPKVEEKEEKVESEEGEKEDKTEQRAEKPRSIFDAFDEFIGVSTKFEDLFGFNFRFPKFEDFSKRFEDTRKAIDEMKKNGKSRFYDFSCKIDPDGHVHVKRVSNDGTVEKDFRIGDDGNKENVRKIDIKVDEDDAKTELKNLIK